MRILEQVIQEETFDIEVQYCDPDECLHDCIHSGTNNCDAIITGWPLDESMTDTELQRLMFAKTTRNIWNGMVTVFANGLSGLA